MIQTTPKACMKLTLKSFWVSRCLSEGAVCGVERMFQIAERFLRKDTSYCITADRGSFSVSFVSENFILFCFFIMMLTCAIAHIWLSV